jgi:hypothetical protein
MNYTSWFVQCWLHWGSWWAVQRLRSASIWHSMGALHWGRLVAAGGRGWGLGGAGGTAAAGAPVCAARGAVLRPGGRRALLCARTCATCCWARDWLARSLALSLSLCLPGLSGMVHASDVHHWTKSTGRFTVTKSQSRSIQEWWRICRRFTPSWTQAAGMPPPEYSQVRSDELPVSMRMRMRVVMCGYACTCAREFNSASRP